MLAPRWSSPLATLRQSLLRPAHAPSKLPSSPFSFPHRPLCSSSPTHNPRSTSFLNSYRIGLALALPVSALGLSLAFPSSSAGTLQCQPLASDRSYARAPVTDETDLPPSAAAGEAESILSPRDLGFGTVSGICVGVFVKKGLRALAFTLGGIFVLLQYLSSRSLISINWEALTGSYDRLITSRVGPPASKGGNRLGSLWSWFIDFVGANVQSRATFVAGVLLGFRLG
ncbi:hypothetical protein NBRC10513v2_004155 [Rhodotorula toruloides]|uniref:BY PROTMAP: gi/472580530/gb/EMS18322.1/ FUN14 family protein [Rhodosporidium toruloides NP11] gi/647401901/emb/CDR48256.1/ RHTO0S16e04654g1_1 [Rhodosporidium toruloides] n=1 Tax=Rhodotorula toruloides TaxID=5286 RepID=A0A0K3CM54_RHOTO|nr:FUN14 family-domain containing protein [Rhodotorula toruloides]